MARLWKTFWNKDKTSSLRVYGILVRGRDNHVTEFTAVKRGDEFEKIRCARCNKHISTKYQGKAFVPIYNPSSGGWSCYNRTCYRQKILPKVTGKKCGTGYKNTSLGLWRWYQ